MHTPTPLGKFKASSQAFRTFFALLTLMVGLGFAPAAQAGVGFKKNFVIVNANNSGNTFYDTNLLDTGNPNFDGANLGNFFNTTGSLVLNGAESQTFKNGTGNVTGVQIFYRVYLSSTPAGSYSDIALGYNSDQGGSPDFLQTWKTENAGRALVTPGMTPGNYTLEVYIQGNSSNEPNFFDSKGGANYKATFSVAGVNGFATPGTSTTWLGGAAGAPNNWLNSLNWTAGIPDQRSDAIIPTPPRPFEPRLANPSATYAARNLMLQGASTSNRALVRVTSATLNIYGDLSNQAGGLLATTDAGGDNSATIIFAGANQFVDYGRFATTIIRNNVVDATTGVVSPNSNPVIKSVTENLEILNQLDFDPGIKAVVRTTRLTASGPELSASPGGIAVDLGDLGAVNGETNTAFVLGVLRAARDVKKGIRETFGNIGIDITINDGNLIGGGEFSSTRGSITRTVGDPYTPFVDGNGQPINGSARSIKRIFGNSFSALQQGFSANVRLHYQNSGKAGENGPGTYDELFGNTDGNLAMYRTSSNSTFTNLGGVNVINTTPNSPYSTTMGFVEVQNLNNINTLTLADRNSQLPLPITLSAFEARRSGNNALLTWTTANEKDNKGFTVEVSTDGRSFRSAGFVASTRSTSNQRQDYRFVDAAAGKTGKRYYRLRQEDLDGKISLSDVRVVDFNGSNNTASTLQAFPNPFTADLSVSVAGAGSGPATLRLLDLTGRVIQSQSLQLDGTSATIPLRDLSRLNAGIYLVQLTLPSGQVQSFKVQKQ